MSLPGLIIALVMSLIALALVLRPLLRPARRAGAAVERARHQRDELASYYERSLTNIRDLDEDFATGKINEGDYREEREVWAGRGVRLLRTLDELERAAYPPADAAEAERIDRVIEEAVAAYRQGSPSARQDGETT